MSIQSIQYITTDIDNNHFVYWTDGGGNSGNCSWAYGASINHKISQIVAGGMRYSTNNIAEMTAVINAIKSAPLGSEVTIYTDSSYVQKGFHHPSYLRTWMNNGWRSSNKKPVKNQDLWEEMIKLSMLYKINMILVPGHSGIEFNEKVDKACTWILKHFDELEKNNELDRYYII